jgi:hypothetical protein
MRKKKTLEQFFSRTKEVAQQLDSGEYVPLRSLAEEITEGFDALKRIRELEAECDRLYRIIELDEREELKVTVRSFFEDFIDIREESDSGRVFAPITISSCRCMMIEPLAEVLAKMRTLSGAKKESKE